MIVGEIFWMEVFEEIFRFFCELKLVDLVELNEVLINV